MKSIYPLTALLLSVSQTWAATTTEAAPASQANGVEEPSAAPTLGAPSVQGCFSSSGSLVLNSTQTFNSKGKCATDICSALGKAVAGTTSGSDCWCGDKYPPKDTLAKDSNCNIGCTGYPLQACGGTDFWTIYNTGLVLGVPYASDDSANPSATSSARPSQHTPAETAVVTVSGGTVVVTATNSAETGGSGASSRANTGAIAAGVVVGVVVIASVVGGILFMMRRRRNKELEEEHRHNAAVNAFMNGGKPPGSSGGNSITDARLDPVMTHRRLSDGSIADNQDYSRKILRVTNA